MLPETKPQRPCLRADIPGANAPRDNTLRDYAPEAPSESQYTRSQCSKRQCPQRQRSQCLVSQCLQKQCLITNAPGTNAPRNYAPEATFDSQNSQSQCSKRQCPSQCRRANLPRAMAQGLCPLTHRTKLEQPFGPPESYLHCNFACVLLVFSDFIRTLVNNNSYRLLRAANKFN